MDSILDSGKITRTQYAIIAVCFLMNVLDGVDVLVISYCASAIAKDWALSPETLGLIFSAGLVGMTVGSLLLAPLADKIGRKNMILISAVIMGGSMYASAYTTTAYQLMFMRLVSGIGIGSMLASTAALVAEYTPVKSKNFWISLVLAGYPVGAVMAGFVTAKVLPVGGWERMFQLSGLASFITLPFIWFFLEESIEFYLKKQPPSALQKANVLMTKVGEPTMEVLPSKVVRTSAPVWDILRAPYLLPTLQIWISLFLVFGSLYFLVSWIPKLSEIAGLSPELAIYAGTLFNVGAFFGIATQGYFSTHFGLKKTIGIFLVLTGLLMGSFRFFIGSDWLLPLFILLGFGIQGGFVGMYALAARLYPTEVRTTGVGWSIGIGRLGGIAGPYIGGILVGMGFTISNSFLVFAIPTLISGVLIYMLATDKVK